MGEKPEDSLSSGGGARSQDELESENRNSTGRLPNDACTKTSGFLFGTRCSAKHGFLVLADGTEVPYISYMKNACSSRAFQIDGEMPVEESKVDDRVVQTLRDTGCNGMAYG